MPIVEPAGSRVLVTGANGYIAYYIIRNLLEQGYSVRAAVRSLAKGQHLKEYYSSYGDKLELFAIEDITKVGAFDDAVKGVDAVIHTASAADFTMVDPEDYIKPAVEGSIGLLESAKKFGDKVKRIVITSTVTATGFNMAPPAVTFDETIWNDQAVELVNAEGKGASPLIKYTASKVLAERAAWDFYHKYKGVLQWELVTILPAHCLGPPLQVVKGPESLNISLWLFWDGIASKKSDEELKGPYNYIHVQDIALAHIAAIRKEKAGGERIIISAGASTWQHARNLVYSLKPELYSKGILPRGNPDLDSTPLFIYNGEKGKNILGLKYANEEKLIRDTLADFEARGYFAKPVNV
ncbi:hypothetical protein CPB84DRAFT_1709067 [Gymnopilus junonius]|uniref:NAD-dependent epimerase/dehydratase domain-containing protein n=1 Tax=Gymnopilus junonius TaxID=109634 RepID=A0A9P5NMJ9_GYMJU|nr:hypothetical protein CPB84DRAFT_1709067 [Gymnopilus junonius]